ncbi:hypothetical protein AMTR_s00024p00230520 [Amborella trichopoda]|uniref:PNPLA domain-containing protein n=1 Tax=Amborella trichopoda TaxID=13333 RepID=W1PT79_AMBTC|nr:hypothetical protein AMTR_s00024p00230520 [Amborella trichopoda]
MNVLCLGNTKPGLELETQIAVMAIVYPNFGNFITILSIDGGGVRGMIPAVILTALEEELQVHHDLSLASIIVSFLSLYVLRLGRDYSESAK